jgi:hypothetical protein
MPATRVLQNTGKISKGNFEGKVYTHTEVPSETDMAETKWRNRNMPGAIRVSRLKRGKSFPLISHEDSEWGWNVGLPSLL